MGEIVGVIAPLLVLALADSTSFGTFVLPLVALSQPRVRAGVVLVYLFTLAIFYWLLGVALWLGLGALMPALSGLEGSLVASWVQLVVGALLLAWGIFFDLPLRGRRLRRERARASGEAKSRSWQDRISGEGARLSTGAVLALAAGGVEALSMVPYIAAIGLMTSADLPWGVMAVLLLVYCMVMIAPALIALGLRLALSRWVETLLARISAWFSARSSEILAWTLGVVGYLLAADAAGRVLALSGQ